MSLVEADQPPLPGVEQGPVAVHPGDLVGRDRDRSDLLLAAVVQSDVGRVDRGVFEQFLAPLAGEFAGGDENQRLAADRRDGRDGATVLPDPGGPTYTPERASRKVSTHVS